MGSSSVDCRDENVESWILSKSQDYFYCGAKPGENIMPLELAIKRELAYRKRIMMLQSQTPVGSTVASMPSKIPIGSTVASMSSQIPVGSAVASMSSQIPMGSIDDSMSSKLDT
ncbi:uncharacterized protein LOC122078805 isoform X2 [Macadamia integrifolia]|uniref:uncharacterized protein LOC122078805 isoform X2 n=1 Tax=Macadamia integrifolia TaxID=60698 RepID=UPI001C4F3F7C|nr:uncharacterized protein LOC122078805 isoform X2 [Macadamia integrifolia]